jgi:hypothetical protein
VFSLSITVGTDILIDGQRADVGFLPNGLHDRLVCKALAWCREISYCDTELTRFTSWKSFAILQAASILFRVTLVLASNCVQVDVARNTATCYSTVVTELDQRWKSVRRIIESGVIKTY